jgi:hypothetical protein
VEVTDVNNNTRSASTNVRFLNQDRVRGIGVSQTDNPRAPVTVDNTQWYGNGDVFVTVDIVNYSGATYSLSGTPGSGPFPLQASGGQDGSLSGHEVRLTGATGLTATPVSGQPQLRLARSANSSISATLTAEVHPSSTSTTPVARRTFGLDNVAPSGTPTVQYRRIVRDYNFTDLDTSTLTLGTSQTLFRGTGATDGGVGGVTYRVAFRVSGNTVATATLPNAPSPGVTVSGLINFVTYQVVVTAVEDALGNRQILSTFTPRLFRLADDPITLSNVTVNNTTPDARGTFNVSFTARNISGILTPGIALKLGNKLVPIPISVTSAGISADAYFGAQYVLYVVDDAGNFAVADLPVNVRQPASDRTPPTITVSLPSSVTLSASFTVSGTHSDPPNQLAIFLSHGSLGDFEWYLNTTTFTSISSSSYSFSVTAPNYTGPLGVVVLGRDDFDNLGSATGTVNVQE